MSNAPHHADHLTPANVARYLAEHALDGWWANRSPDSVAGPRVLDPACGDGALLAAAQDWLASRLPPPASTGHHLFGLDVNPKAVVRARERLAGAGTHQAAAPARLAVGDALLAHPVLAGGFDVILGNPPYLFGEHLAGLDRRGLAERFELARGGQPDLYQIFYERTVRSLLRPGGWHAFLVPDALLARDDHHAVRRFVGAHLTVERICQVGRVFPTARGVSAVAIIGRYHQANDEGDVAVDRWVGTKARESHRIGRRFLMPSDGGPWSIDAPPEWFGSRGLRARLESTETTLGNLLAPAQVGITRGEELGKRTLQRAPRRDRAHADPTATALYAGESVRRHWLDLPTCQTAHNRISKASRYYAGPKILLVKTGAGPVAATCFDSLPVLQSVYALHLQDDVRRRVPEDAVVAIVCSSLLATYCWHRFTFGKQVQPQLTIRNVRSLPVPRLKALAGAAEPLASHVARIRNAARAGRACAQEDLALDRLVASLYGLDLDDWLPLVRAALARLPPSQRSRWYDGFPAPR